MSKYEVRVSVRGHNFSARKGEAPVNSSKAFGNDRQAGL